MARAARPGRQAAARAGLATAELRISRSTLREDLTTLTQSGHLVARARPHRRYVRHRAPPLAELEAEPLGQEAWSILEHRVAVETRPRSSPERAEAHDLDRLDEQVEKMAEAEDFQETTGGPTSASIGVAEAARSPRLLSEMTEVRGAMSDLIALIAHPERVLTHSNAQHAALVGQVAPPRLYAPSG